MHNKYAREGSSLVPRAHLSGDAVKHAELWGGPIEELAPAALDGAELVIDAIFGACLSRALNGAVVQTLATAATRTLTLVAIDVPSGLMGDTGANLGAVHMSLYVAFVRP